MFEDIADLIILKNRSIKLLETEMARHSELVEQLRNEKDFFCLCPSVMRRGGEGGKDGSWDSSGRLTASQEARGKAFPNLPGRSGWAVITRRTT